MVTHTHTHTHKIWRLKAKLIFVAMFMMALFKTDVGWGQIDVCGEFPSNTALSSNPDEIVWDRFGNSYDLNSFALRNNSTTNVTLNLFNLEISGDLNQEYVDLITHCFETFEDILIQRTLTTPCGAELETEKLLISIDIGTLSNPNALAGASAFYGSSQVICESGERSLNYSTAQSKLLGMKSQLPSSTLDGLILINKIFYDNNDFHLDFNRTPSLDKYDLKTILLHEILHILAFADTFTAFNVSNYSLLLSNSNGPFFECTSDCYSLNNPHNSQSTVYLGAKPLQVFSNSNRSHLHDPEYIMYPTLSRGVRKTVTQDEIEIMCELGLETNICDGEYIVSDNTNSALCSDYQDCCTNDFYFCGNSAEINIDDFLCFFHHNLQYINISRIKSIHSGVSVDINGNNVYIVNNSARNDIVLSVTYQATANNICINNSKYFRIKFDSTCDCEIPFYSECDNMLCYSNFDSFDGEREIHLGYPFYFSNTPHCSYNTPDIAHTNGNSSLFLLSHEAVVFKVQEGPFDGCINKLSFDVSAQRQMSLEIWGSNIPPCHKNDKGISRDCTESTECSDGSIFTPFCIETLNIPSLPVNTSYEIEINNTDVKYLLFVSDDGNPFPENGLKIDNLFYYVESCLDNAEFTFSETGCREFNFVQDQFNSHQSFLWDFGDGNQSTLPNPVHTYLQNGEYTVSLTVRDFCGNQTSNSVVINVLCCSDFELPQINVTGTCPDFIFVPSIISENYSYQWYINGQLQGTNGVFMFEFTENGTYTISLTYINECGEKILIELELIVECICDPLPLSFTHSIICLNGNNQVSFDYPSSDIDLIYLWDFGDGNTSNQPNPIHTYARDGTYTVTLTATNSCGETELITITIDVYCNTTAPFCGGDFYIGYYLVDGTNGLVDFEQYIIQNNVPRTGSWWIRDQNFVVRGDVTIPRSMVFIDCHFIFDAGASMQVNTTSKSHSVIFTNCNLESCGTVMWKGIKAMNGWTRVVNGSSIKDAEFGIEMDASYYGVVSAHNTKFHNNAIGIKVANSNGYFMRGNEFKNTGLNSNKAPYSGQALHYTSTKAGIYFQNVNAVLGTQSQYGNNVFEYVGNGVLVENGNATIIGNTFLNIYNNTCSSTSIPINILEYCSKSIGIKGGGIHNVAENTFEAGIGNAHFLTCADMEGPHVMIEKNDIEGTSDIIEFHRVSNANNITIKNQLPVFGAKINASNNAAINVESTCTNNRIFINSNQFNLSDLGSAIRIMSANDDFNKQIRYNEFNILNTGQNQNTLYQIFTRNCKKFDISHNHFKNFGSSKSGAINYSRSENFTIKENLINFQGNIQMENGIYTNSNSSHNTFECNELFDVKHGFVFPGTNHTNIDFRSNLMHENATGISVSGNFPGQDMKGNVWVGVQSKAEHTSGGSFPWFVNPNQQIPSNNPPYLLNGKFRPTTVQPPFWFVDQSGIAQHCFGEIIYEEEGPVEWEELKLFLEDESVDTPWERWELQSEMYKMAQENPSLWDTQYEILSQLSESIPEYLELDDIWQGIFKLWPIEAESLDNVRNTISSIEALKNDLWDVSDENSEPTEEVMEQVLLYSQQLALLKSQELSILNDIKHRKGVDLVEFKTVVSNLPVTEIFHEFMKTMYTFKADMVLYGREAAVNTHFVALQFISPHCYNDYGNAVADAIGYLNTSIQETNINYDECGEVGFRTISQDNTESHIRLYPNPASSSISVYWHNTEIKNIKILGMDGNLIFEIRQNFEVIDVSHLNEGVYLLKAESIAGESAVSRFIKIK